MTTQRRFRWNSASRSIEGNVRKVNEDAYVDMPGAGLWAVADGMGGHNAGDVASRMIAEALAGFLPQDRPSAIVDEVEDRLMGVNDSLYRRSIDEPGAGLSGSTVAVLLAFDRYAVCLWAGDSRVYRCNGMLLEQITRDHSAASETAESGVRDPAVPSNVITRAVGGTDRLYLDIELRELRDGDCYLLCSDGLIKELTDLQIATYLGRLEPQSACTAMIEQAAAGECVDNVTVVAVQFGEAR
jgi:serine/threonine protein phosphatase PrpC